VTPQERQAVIAKSPVRGKYDQEIDSESAFEMLQKRVKKEAAPTEQTGSADQGGGGIGGFLGSIFGTKRQPGQRRLTTGQLVTREITRSVTNRVAGKVAADIGKSLGGSVGGSIGRAIVRGALGGILRR
jgi:hypothetical protein